MSAGTPQPATHPQARNGGLAQALVDWIVDLGDVVVGWFVAIGDVALFAVQTMRWLVFRLPNRGTILPNFYQIGVLSLPVIALTGTFIGMVLGRAKCFRSLGALHLDSRLGAVINISVVRVLGPVLAATMLAGRVGSAMAAELARCESPNRSTP